MNMKKIKNEAIINALKRIEKNSLQYNAEWTKKNNERMEKYNLDYWLKVYSGIRKKHYTASFDKFIIETKKQREIIEGLKFYSRKKTNSESTGAPIVLLYGKSGTGKSMLASSAVIENRGFYTTYEWYKVMLDSSKSFKSKESPLDVVKRITQVNFLVLDEIDKGVNNRDKINDLSFICRERYENNLPTWLVGNVTWEWMKKFIDSSVLDRCRESGKSFLFDWESYRKKLREEKI